MELQQKMEFRAFFAQNDFQLQKCLDAAVNWFGNQKSQYSNARLCTWDGAT